MEVTFENGIYSNGTTTLVKNSAGEYEIGTLEQLKLFRDAVNQLKEDNTQEFSFKDQTVKLTADIDLQNEEWTPIGNIDAIFQGTFDGQGHTISNLKITKGTSKIAANCYIGFFGHTKSPATITNLTINNVDITGSLYVGAIVGYGFTGKEISNCHVTGYIEIEGWWYIGGIGGNGYVSTVSGCTVEGNDGSYIKALNNGSYVGGIWGYRGEGSNVIANSTVSNIDISGTDRIGGICGIAHYQNTIEGCTIKESSITATNDIGNVGLIAGANLGSTANGPALLLNNKVDVTTSENFTLEDKIVENPPMLGNNDHNGSPSSAAIVGDVERDSDGKITDATLTVVGTDKNNVDLNTKLPLADGLAFYPNSDGTVKVYDDAGYVAAIGDTRYSTLAEAQAAVQSGETITILQDISTTAVEMNGFGIATWNNTTFTASEKINAVAGENLLSGNVKSAQLLLEGLKEENRTLTIAEASNVDLYIKGKLDDGLLDVGFGLSKQGVVTGDQNERVYYAQVLVDGDVSVEKYSADGNASSGAIYIRPYSELVVTGKLDVVGEVHNRGSLVVDGGTMKMSVWATPKLLGYTTGDRMTVTNNGTMTVSGASAVTFGEASASQLHMAVVAQYADGMFATISNGGKFEADTLAFVNAEDVTLTVTGEDSLFKLYSADGRTEPGNYTYVQNEGRIVIENNAVFDVSGLVNTNFVNTGSIDISSASAGFATVTNNNAFNVTGNAVLDADFAAASTGTLTISNATLEAGTAVNRIEDQSQVQNFYTNIVLKDMVTLTGGAYLNSGWMGNLTMGYGTGDSGTLNITDGAQISVGGTLYFGTEEALLEDGIFNLNISGTGSLLQSNGYNGGFYIFADAVVSVSNGGTIANNSSVRTGATYFFGAIGDTVAANVNFRTMELVEKANVTIQGGAVADLGVLVFGDGNMSYDGSFTLAADSQLKIDSYSSERNAAEITISGTDTLEAPFHKLIDYMGSNSVDYSQLVSNWNDISGAVTVVGDDLFFGSIDTVKVDSAWKDQPAGTEVESGFYYLGNAFANMTEAFAAAKDGATILVADGTYNESVVVSGNRNLEIGRIEVTSLTLGTYDEAFTGNFTMQSLAVPGGGSADDKKGRLVLRNGQFSMTDFSAGVIWLGNSDFATPDSEANPGTSYTISSGSVVVDQHFYIGCADPDVSPDRYGAYTLTLNETGSLKVGSTLNVRQDGVFNVIGADTTADLSQFHTSGVSNISDGAEVTALNMMIYNDDHKAQVNVTDSTITMSLNFGGKINIGYDKYRNGTMSLKNSTLDANNLFLGGYPRSSETNSNPDAKSYLNADNSTVKLAADLTIYDTGVLNLVDSTLTVNGAFTNGGAINMDVNSQIVTATVLNNTGSITVDVTGAAESGIYKLIDYTGSDTIPDYGNIQVVGDLGKYSISIVENDLYLANVDTSTLKVNASWSGTMVGTDMGEGFYYGFNAFDNMDKFYSTIAAGGVSKIELQSDVLLENGNPPVSDMWFKFQDDVTIDSNVAGEVRTIQLAGHELLLTSMDQSRGNGGKRVSITLGKDINILTDSAIWFGYCFNDVNTYPEYAGNFASDITLNGNVTMTNGQAHIFGHGSTMTISETGSLTVEKSDIQTRGSHFIVNGTGKEMAQAQVQLNHENIEGDSPLIIAGDVSVDSPAEASWTLNNTFVSINTYLGINTATGSRASGIDAALKMNSSRLTVGQDLTMADAATVLLDNQSELTIGGNIQLGSNQTINKGSWITVSNSSQLSAVNLKVDAGTTVEIEKNSTVTLTGSLTNYGSISMDYSSSLEFNDVDEIGSITVDMAGAAESGVYKLIDYTGAATGISYDTITLNNNTYNYTARTINNDLYLVRLDGTKEYYVNSEWSSSAPFEEVTFGDDGKAYYGINALDSISDAAATDVANKIFVVGGSYSGDQYLNGHAVEIGSANAPVHFDNYVFAGTLNENVGDLSLKFVSGSASRVYGAATTEGSFSAGNINLEIGRDVTLSDRVGAGKVDGGSLKTGDVTISVAGNLTNLYGGAQSWNSGVVTHKSVTLNFSGSAYALYGAGYASNGGTLIVENDVVVNASGSQSTSYFYAAGSSMHGSVISINGSVTTNVTGGEVLADGIMGGGFCRSDISSTSTAGSMTINGGTYVSISGGSISAVYGGTHTYSDNGKLESVSTISGGTHVTISGGSVELVYGGGYNAWGSKSTIDTSSVQISGNSTTDNVYGGAYVVGGGKDQNSGNSCTITGDVSVVISGDASVNGNVFGGGNVTWTTGTAASYINGVSTVTVEGGTIAGNVAGGGKTEVDVSDNKDGILRSENGATSLKLTGGTIKGSVVGGGVSIDNYGWGTTLINRVAETSVVIDGSVIEGSAVAGAYADGGNAAASVDGNAVISILSGRVDGNVYGGGLRSEVGGDAIVTIRGGTVGGDVYAGGSDADVRGNTTVNLIGGTVAGSIYGGSEMSGTVDGIRTLNLGAADADLYTGTLTGVYDFNVANVTNANVTVTGEFSAEQIHIADATLSLNAGFSSATTNVSISLGSYNANSAALILASGAGTLPAAITLTASSALTENRYWVASGISDSSAFTLDASLDGYILRENNGNLYLYNGEAPYFSENLSVTQTPGVSVNGSYSYTASFKAEGLLSGYTLKIYDSATAETPYQEISVSADSVSSSFELSNTTQSFWVSVSAVGENGKTTDSERLEYSVKDYDSPVILSLTADVKIDGVTFSCDAADNFGVHSYEFLVDGQSMGIQSENLFILDGASLSSGSHSYSVKVYDAAGNLAASADQSFEIDTPAPTPVFLYSSLIPQNNGEYMTVFATYSDPNAALEYRIGESGEWLAYDAATGVEVHSTTKVYFRAQGVVAPEETSVDVRIVPVGEELNSEIVQLAPSEETLYEVVYSFSDGTEKAVELSGNTVEHYALPEDTTLTIVEKDAATGEVVNVLVEETPVASTTAEVPEKIVAVDDGFDNVFFAMSTGRWSGSYSAQHLGDGVWSGTGELVSLSGKNRFSTVFTGGADATILLLTDDAKGDAFFLDDVYTANGSDARISKMTEILAGNGNDIVDLTSTRFAYEAHASQQLIVRGGDGNDIIWGNACTNILFGDAGNDKVYGGSGNDILIGGSGNDTMHGGGGDDVFCYGSSYDWGKDTITQLSGGSVTLYLDGVDRNDCKISGSKLTWSDGIHSGTLTLKGVSWDSVKFFCAANGDGDLSQIANYEDLTKKGAFAAVSSH